jgi:PadR family transcriptional regulator PadR
MGPPRKYFSLTEKGRAVLEEMDIAWKEVVDSIEYIKGK